MDAQPEPRFKKRLPCRVRRGPSTYSGMVVDLSRTGLFVQTGAGAKPGESDAGRAVAPEGCVGERRSIGF